MVKMRFSLVTAALLLAIAVVPASASYGLDTALAEEFKADPLANKDAFASLKPGVKRFLSHPHGNVESKLQSMLSLATMVTVKLVGFSGDQRNQLEVQFSRYLDALHKDDAVYVIGASKHSLSVRSKLQVEVVSATKGLADTIAGAIEAHIRDRHSASPLSTLYHLPIPYTVVDDLVRADLSQPLNSYVIYVLNLRPQSRSYGYDYKPAAAGGDGDDGVLHAAFTKCLGHFWTGRERYMWIDLAAGPVEYGPSLSGEGLIVRDETYETAAAAMGVPTAQKALLADLASLVWSASQMLLAPALRVPVYVSEETEVHLYHIKDQEEDKDAIDWDVVEASLSGADLHLPGHRLRFKRLSIDLSSCALCSAVLAQSTKTYTSRMLLERYSLFVNEYFDSKQLHHLLSGIDQELAALAGAGETPQAHVVPVYVFDLNLDRVVLLDKYHQAIAFTDMVVAVRTRGFQTLSEFNCNSRPIVVQTRRVERPIVASLLQTLWGVAPSHLTWSSHHNSTVLDYTWSLGQTPFGPFSEMSSLSFSQVDAARRNPLLVLLNSTVWGAIHVLDAVKDMGGEGRLQMSGAARTETGQRWNLLLYKLEKVTSAMSHFDFDMAVFLLKSAQHDMYRLHTLIYDASSSLNAAITCFTQPSFPWAWLAAFVTSVLLLVLLYLRREQLFRNKRKRF